MTKFNDLKIDIKAENIALAFTVKTSKASTLEDFLADLAENIKKVDELKSKNNWIY